MRLHPLLAPACALVLAAQAPIRLPAFRPGTASLDAALQARRTERRLGGPALSLEEASRLLWSAQGENRPGKRTVPSARARYPLELYLLTEGSASLPAGLYHYLPREHALQRLGDRGVSGAMGSLKGMQSWIAKAPAIFLFTGVSARLGGMDAAQQELYTFWEGGAAAQSLLLQASAMSFGSGVASGIDLEGLRATLGLPPAERPIVVVALGRLK